MGRALEHAMDVISEFDAEDCPNGLRPVRCALKNLRRGDTTGVGEVTVDDGKDGTDSVAVYCDECGISFGEQYAAHSLVPMGDAARIRGFGAGGAVFRRQKTGGERRVEEVEVNLNQLASRLEYSWGTASKAFGYFMAMREAGASRGGRGHEMVEVVAMFTAARSLGYPVTMRDICSTHTHRVDVGRHGATGQRIEWEPVDVRLANRLRQRMVREGVIPRIDVRPAALVVKDSSFSQSELNEEEIALAQQYAELPVRSGQPLVVAAASTWLAAQETGKKLTQKKTGEAFGVSIRTMKAAIKDMREALGRIDPEVRMRHNPVAGDLGPTNQQVHLLRSLKGPATSSE